MSSPAGLKPSLRSSDASSAGASHDDDAVALGEVTLAALEQHGYAHITKPLDVESFEALAARLGFIAMRTDLAITPGRSSIVYKPDAIAFHQDNPTINIIGWYCVQQDDIDGSAQLIDTVDIADHFTLEQLTIMTGIEIRCPDADPGRHNPDKGLISYFLWPMLTKKSMRCEVYYVPWLMLDSYSAEQQQVIQKFDEYLLAKEVMNLRLNEGETLFIDNNRLLHGRGPIHAGSKRFLKRVWIKRDS
jgi:hypothetical protein